MAAAKIRIRNLRFDLIPDKSGISGHNLYTVMEFEDLYAKITRHNQNNNVKWKESFRDLQFYKLTFLMDEKLLDHHSRFKDIIAQPLYNCLSYEDYT